MPSDIAPSNYSKTPPERIKRPISAAMSLLALLTYQGEAGPSGAVFAPLLWLPR